MSFDPGSWDAIQLAIHDQVTLVTGIAGDHVIWAQQGGARPVEPWISLNINTVTESGIDWTDWVNNTFTFSNLTIASVSGSTLNIPAHGLQTGDGPVRLTAGGTLPIPLATTLNYWVIRIDADHIQLAKNYLNSVNPWDGSASIPITLTSAGTGTNLVVPTSVTERKDQGMVAYTRGTWLASMSIQCFAGNTSGLGTFDPFATLSKLMLRFRSSPVINALNTAGIGINDFTPVKSIGSKVSMTVFEPRAVMDFKFFLAAQVEDFGTYIARVNYTNEQTGKTETVERPDS